MPFVAVWGLGTNGAAVAAVLGAVNVVLCWALLLQATPRRAAALPTRSGVRSANRC